MTRPLPARRPRTRRFGALLSLLTVEFVRPNPESRTRRTASPRRWESLILDTAGSVETWRAPDPREIGGGFRKRSGSPIMRIMVWTLLLAAPFFGYFNRDLLVDFAYRTVHKHSPDTARQLVPLFSAASERFAQAATQTQNRVAREAERLRPVAYAPPAFVMPAHGAAPTNAPSPGTAFPGTMMPLAAPMAATPPPVHPPAQSETRVAPAVASAPPRPAMPAVQTPSARVGGDDEAVGVRGRNGHFSFNASINGVSMPVLFDTGASVVALRAEDAARLGVDIDSLGYSIRTRTANGVAEAAPYTIESLTIGGITVRNVSAIISRRGAMSDNLLGMSFMSRLAGYNVEGNRLILRGR